MYHNGKKSPSANKLRVVIEPSMAVRETEITSQTTKSPNKLVTQFQDVHFSPTVRSGRNHKRHVGKDIDAAFLQEGIKNTVQCEQYRKEG